MITNAQTEVQTEGLREKKRDLLTTVLRADGVFALLSGAILILAAGSVASLIDLSNPAALIVLGVVLIFYGGDLLYFAGRGTTLSDGAPAIVCQGGNPETGEGCVPLTDIRDACGDAKVILFLDGAFVGKVETRGPGFDGAELSVPPRWATGDRFVVFTAATEGSAEVRYVDDSSGIIETGLFTQGLRELLRGQGDADGNGVITAGEATLHLQQRVTQLKGTAAPAIPVRLAGAETTTLWTTSR